MSTFKTTLLLLVLFFINCPVRSQTFTNSSHLLNIESMGTTGASAIDFNNDGLIDIYHPGRIYLNRGDDGFTDVRFGTGIIEGESVFGAAFGDYDNDGYLDILFEDLGAPSRLYRNNRNLTFTQTNETVEMSVLNLAQGAAWADFNLDGNLDLFVNQDDGQNQLFKNLGNGKFDDISLSSGVQAPGNAYGMSWGDFNRDGYPDVFIATCANDPARSIKHLFINNGDETFTNINVTAGVNDSLASWGTVWFDYDNDGDLDIYAANLDHAPRPGFNRLYRNDGDNTFTDVAFVAGVAGEADENSYGVSAADFDNDGWLDIYVASINPRHRLYHNNGDGTFIDIAQSAGVAQNFNLAVAVADFDDNGWIDIFHPSVGNSLWLNDGGSNHWLTVKTRGVTSNYHGIGTRLQLHAGQQIQVREIKAGDGFCAQNLDLSAHFGLGNTTIVDSLILNWPGGERQKLTNLAVDQKITVVEGMQINQPPETFTLQSPADGDVLGLPTSSVEFTWQAAFDSEGENLSYRLTLFGPDIDTVFTAANTTSFSVAADVFSQNQICGWTVNVSDGFSIVASTDVFNFDDGVCQPATIFSILNENQLNPIPSSTGGASWPDVDNNGVVDLFLTARSGQNVLFSPTPGQGFAQLFAGDLTNDDFGSRAGTWGDYDNDGDLDVFVTGFGEDNWLYDNENGIFTRTGLIPAEGGRSLSCTWLDFNGDELLDLIVANLSEANFLYQNTGSGFIKITEDEIISDAGTTLAVVASDYDDDGDVDVYIAGLTDSGLFVNNGDGTFSKMTEGDVAAFSENCRSANWIDFENDGDIDLYVARDNGLTDLLFENQGGGVLSQVLHGPVVESAGSTLSSSWADYDNDGDLDLFVGNRGFSLLFSNFGNGDFEEVLTDITFLNGTQNSSWADYDHDGDMDLLAVDSSRDPILYTNMGNDNNWINIHCVGTTSNRAAIGTKVRIKAAILGQPYWQMREISGQTGYLSQNSLNAAFGLGDAALIDSLRIEWSSGLVEFATNLKVNDFLTAIEGVGVTSVKDAAENSPLTFSLEQNYPNPFNPETSISYEVHLSADIKIEIFNALGQKVRTLVEAKQVPGFYRMLWDGKDDTGVLLPSGPYFYRIATGQFSKTRTMLFLK